MGRDWITRSASILCNQWYHNTCLRKPEKQHFAEYFFGIECNHHLWFESLNEDAKDKVLRQLKVIRNYCKECKSIDPS